MTMKRALALAWCGVAAAALTACGGGGSPPASAEAPKAVDTPVRTAVTLSGVVATGAAFAEATVSVTDRTGAVVGTSAPVGADGRYSATLALDAQAPFVLVARRVLASGEAQSLVSVADTAASGTVNVTPVTHMIAARLSPSGDPLALAAAVQADPSRVTPAKVAAAVAEAAAVLAPLLEATGTSVTVNPLTTPIVTDGTGYDRLLDSVQVTVTPQPGDKSHIEVTFKVQPTDPGAQPPSVQFSSDASLAQLAERAAAVRLQASALVPSGTAARIAEFLATATACYALPLEQRVAGASASDTNVVGGAADVLAPPCREMFAGGNPSAYLSNGARVGRNAANGGAFASLFRRGATGVVFSQGTLDFLTSAGDVVASYRWRDPAGNEGFDTLVLRADASSGRLAAIGNQYLHGGGVQAYHQSRHFLVPDSTGASQAGFDYSSTGYTVHVPNVVDAGGRPVYDRVVVTPPQGSTLLLRPDSGISYLVLTRADGSFVSSTNFVRLRSRYHSATTAGHPRDLDTGLFFVPTDLEEDEITAISQHAVWTYAYFLAGNTGATPDAVQHYKTRARALTLGELQRKGLASLTADSVAGLLARPSLIGQVRLPTDGPLAGIAYTVPDGALPPTSTTLWGRMGSADRITGARFDDSATVGSTARSAQIGCSAATVADLHCSRAGGGGYADFAYMNSLHLWAREASGREYARMYAIYRLR
jgi:hypothetical protein